MDLEFSFGRMDQNIKDNG